MESVKKTLHKLSGVFDLSPRPYRLDGFATDTRALRGDVAALASDLKKQLDREPADQRTRQK
jgi:hypothetical protein